MFSCLNIILLPKICYRLALFQRIVDWIEIPLVNLNGIPDIHSFVDHFKLHLWVVDFHRIFWNSHQIVSVFFVFVGDCIVDINQFVLVSIIRLVFLFWVLSLVLLWFNFFNLGHIILWKICFQTLDIGLYESELSNALCILIPFLHKRKDHGSIVLARLTKDGDEFILAAAEGFLHFAILVILIFFVFFIIALVCCDVGEFTIPVDTRTVFFGKKLVEYTVLYYIECNIILRFW